MIPTIRAMLTAFDRLVDYRSRADCQRIQFLLSESGVYVSLLQAEAFWKYYSDEKTSGEDDWMPLPDNVKEMLECFEEFLDLMA